MVDTKDKEVETRLLTVFSLFDRWGQENYIGEQVDLELNVFIHRNCTVLCSIENYAVQITVQFYLVQRTVQYYLVQRNVEYYVVQRTVLYYVVHKRFTVVVVVVSILHGKLSVT